MKEQKNKMRPNNPQSAIRNPQSIELHIEELVLDGFAPGDRYLIAESFEGEVARLFAERGLPPSLMQNVEVARLDCGTINTAAGLRAGEIGARAAQSLYEGLARAEAMKPSPEIEQK